MTTERKVICNKCRKSETALLDPLLNWGFYETTKGQYLDFCPNCAKLVDHCIISFMEGGHE